MRIGRTLLPAASPIPLYDILRALPACFHNDSDNDQLENILAKDFGQKYCFLVSSGKAALTLILTALKDLYPGRNEVIIPAFTCYSVPAAIMKAGLQVKLCEMAPSSLNIDKDHLQEIISADEQENNILCILVTHFFGCPANYSAIQTIVGSKIPIIEDAAQAMGEKYFGKKLGTLGDIGFYSLGRGKALSAMEGGVIITNRDDLGKVLAALTENLPIYGKIAAIKLAIKALLTNILQKSSVFWLPKSIPFLKLGETIYEQNFSTFKISSFQRRLLVNWQERLKTHRKARITNIRFWRKRLPDSLQQACRENINCSMIRLPLFAQTMEERNRLFVSSEKAGLGLMPTYPTPINEIPEIEHLFPDRQYTHAKDICDRLFTIPVHELVTKDDNKQIATLLSKFTE